MFEHALWRFATSGTLILCYGIADHVARRRERGAAKPGSPGWVRPLVIISITAFYLLIGPTGGALLGGWGNLTGIALVTCAIFLRLTRSVRYPDLAGRALLYTALPLAVGVPWGFVVLSLPALVASFICCLRADRAQAGFAGRPSAEHPERRYRLLPGVW